MPTHVQSPFSLAQQGSSTMMFWLKTSETPQKSDFDQSLIFFLLNNLELLKFSEFNLVSIEHDNVIWDENANLQNTDWNRF